MEPLYEAKFEYTPQNLREIVWSIHKKIALGLMAAVGILFFLLLSDSQALPMAKKDCPKELLDFLRNKVKNA